mmetsp:Transcript_61328/g.146206  ORF Transcript_61328/g.146206 Transcript_61328/m.146206 type:complete len:312 (+) Transcript_61328:881-1816(+)
MGTWSWCSSARPISLPQSSSWAKRDSSQGSTWKERPPSFEANKPSSGDMNSAAAKRKNSWRWQLGLSLSSPLSSSSSVKLTSMPQRKESVHSMRPAQRLSSSCSRCTSSCTGSPGFGSEFTFSCLAAKCALKPSGTSWTYCGHHCNCNIRLSMCRRPSSRLQSCGTRRAMLSPAPSKAPGVRSAKVSVKSWRLKSCRAAVPRSWLMASMISLTWPAPARTDRWVTRFFKSKASTCSTSSCSSVARRRLATTSDTRVSKRECAARRCTSPSCRSCRTEYMVAQSFSGSLLKQMPITRFVTSCSNKLPFTKTS